MGKEGIKQFIYGTPEPVSERNYIFERWISFASLDAANISAMETRPISENFLGESGALAQAPHVLAKLALDRHSAMERE